MAVPVWVRTVVDLENVSVTFEDSSLPNGKREVLRRVNVADCPG